MGWARGPGSLTTLQNSCYSPGGPLHSRRLWVRPRPLGCRNERPSSHPCSSLQVLEAVTTPRPFSITPNFFRPFANQLLFPSAGLHTMDLQFCSVFFLSSFAIALMYSQKEQEHARPVHAPRSLGPRAVRLKPASPSSLTHWQPGSLAGLCETPTSRTRDQRGTDSLTAVSVSFLNSLVLFLSCSF